MLPFRHRGLDRLGSEFWMSGGPRIGRGMSAADWTGFGSGSAWLSDFWVSVFGGVRSGFEFLDFGVGIVGLRLRWLVWRLVWCLGCDVEVVGLWCW